MFGGRYLRQRTALGSESTAPQTETTLGLPTGQKRRIYGKNVINLLIFWVFSHFFGQKFAGRSVADPRYFFVFFLSVFNFPTLFGSFPTLFGRLTCSEFSVIHWFFQAHNPTHAERTSLPGKKKEKKKQTGKPRLNLTRSLQQGHLRKPCYDFSFLEMFRFK